ncbi:MAG: heterodisulfide reductase-related iron-sulfur binding cluster [Alphaproteobacteria bacterium]
MREGGLDAPVRHALDWESESFYDEAALDAELRRVFDICHGCRRCFNLCDSFPRLFDLVDESKSGELDTVDSAEFRKVVDACTLCDMCFLTKCPYVPPHEFNLDFPHLMLRYRAVQARKEGIPFADRQLMETDRNGRLAGAVSGLANWATRCSNHATRGVMESVAGIHREAHLPKYCGKSFETRSKASAPEINRDAPAYGRKAVLYATCFTNFNAADTGMAARAVLAKNGVDTEVLHPSCCGMPRLEQGLIGEVADAARKVAATFRPWIEKGYPVVAMMPSCALMLKFEWPLILPDDEDVKLLAEATWDLSEYVVDIARNEGLAPGMQPVPGGVAVHIACHARAQNVGQKAAEMLRFIPDADITVIERCSGHGGAWGIKTQNFDVALKVGKPAARAMAKADKAFMVSECPLAGEHLVQGMERLDGGSGAQGGEEDGAKQPQLLTHPIELLARAYGVASK